MGELCRSSFYDASYPLCLFYCYPVMTVYRIYLVRGESVLIEAFSFIIFFLVPYMKHGWFICYERHFFRYAVFFSFSCVIRWIWNWQWLCFNLISKFEKIHLKLQNRNVFSSSCKIPKLMLIASRPPMLHIHIIFINQFYNLDYLPPVLLLLF